MWVLIISIMSTSGITIDSHDYSSQVMCNQAALSFSETINKINKGLNITLTCVPK